MHRRKVSIRLSAVALLLLVAASCRDSETSTRAIDAGEAPPAKSAEVASDGPKVPADELQDVVAGQSPQAEPPADNPMGGCGMCHIDVEDEVVVSVHFKEKIGCVECHGRSLAHLADENNEVPPDRLFTKKTVDKFCQECHECGRPQPAEQIEPADRPEVHKVCTECHQAHTLAPVERTTDITHIFPVRPRAFHATGNHGVPR